MAFIYVITNLVNKKQYVGKTLGTVEERFKQHCYDSKRRKCEKRPLYDAMNKYGIENFIVKTLEECSDIDSNQREIYWIERLNTYQKGYNATKGGEGKMFFNHEAILKELQICPYPVLIAKKFKCSTSLVSEIAKKNNIKTKNLSAEKTKLLKSKKVAQYSQSGEYLRSFSSTADAARWCFENGFTSCLGSGARGNISDVANGKRKSAFSFIWKYE